MGRLLVTIGIVIGVTALFMGFVFPAAGRIESAVIGVFGTLFLAALVLGAAHGRAWRWQSFGFAAPAGPDSKSAR